MAHPDTLPPEWFVIEYQAAMIEEALPATWEELEQKAAQILTEARFAVERRKEVSLVRGSANVDLVFTDTGANPPSTVFVECKHWRSRVTKAEVHTFRSVVTDAGANSGLLLSSSGFQAGAHLAATFSNVSLISWREFEDLYEARWTDLYLRPALEIAFEPLVDLTEPMSSKLIRKMEHLSVEQSQPVIALAANFAPVAFFALGLYSTYSFAPPFLKRGKLPLPLRASVPPMNRRGLPEEILDITSARKLSVALIQEAKRGLASIDAITGRS